MARQPTLDELRRAVRHLDRGDGVDQLDVYTHFEDDYTTVAVTDKINAALVRGDLWRHPETSRLRDSEKLVRIFPGDRAGRVTGQDTHDDGSPQSVSDVIRRITAEHASTPKAPRAAVESRAGTEAVEHAIQHGEVYETGAYLKITSDARRAEA